MERFGDVSLTVDADHVATVEIHRPPNNFEDGDLLYDLAQAYRAVDADAECRAIVLCSEGKHFCAGGQFGNSSRHDRPGPERFDDVAVLFGSRVPVVSAVQGAAVGAGLGMACSADFRVAAPEARFAANFSRLGFHHGFGLTVTLPMIVGQQATLDLLYTGRRVKGDEALALGLADRLVPLAGLRAAAHDLAAEIARSAPIAVQAIKATMRGTLAADVRAAIDHEAAVQDQHRATNDWREGLAAMNERRDPVFTGT